MPSPKDPKKYKIYIERLSKSHLGKKLTFEQKKKIGISVSGQKNGFYGRNHTPTTIAKIKEKRALQICSEETRQKYRNNRGEKASAWKGGISLNPYPPEFNKELKLKIRNRDNFICCLCQRTEREEFEEFNRALSVNHIDFNKNNLSEENLNTLCLRCNIKINRERDYWTNYFQNLC